MAPAAAQVKPLLSVVPLYLYIVAGGVYHLVVISSNSTKLVKVPLVGPRGGDRCRGCWRTCSDGYRYRDEASGMLYIVYFAIVIIYFILEYNFYYTYLFLVR